MTTGRAISVLSTTLIQKLCAIRKNQTLVLIISTWAGRGLFILQINNYVILFFHEKKYIYIGCFKECCESQARRPDTPDEG